MTVTDTEGLDAGALWQELLEKDDRTSPVEYPDMALITFEEFCTYLAALPARTSPNSEVGEDEAFKQTYADARTSGDFEAIARVLSGRLRQMDKRARAANVRADNAAEALTRLSEERDRLRKALSVLLSCPAIADENHSTDPEWGCQETAIAISKARAALNAGGGND